ncbi:MAG: biotin--[acetyl-CoA-carboxylase] ligase [Burkholderiaceae bacterium]
MNTTIDVSPDDGVGRSSGIEWRRVAEIGSTNDALLAGEFQAGPRGPIVLRADRQLAGRGRRGRRWIADPHRALTFSIAFERPIDGSDAPLAGFSLAVGVALAEALVGLVPDLRLKWPNDLVRGQGKAGGILVETRRTGHIERVVAGIGLNLLEPLQFDREAGPAGALVPVGLFDHAVPTDPDELLHACALAVSVAFEDFVARGMGAFRERWEQFDAVAGRPVVLRDGDREIARGTALGIDAHGGLRIREAGGERVHAVGEVSLRLDAATA